MLKADYRRYIQQAAITGRERLEDGIEQWKNRLDPKAFLGIYTGPANVCVQAHLEGFLYRETNDQAHAEFAKQCLLRMKEVQKYFQVDECADHPEYAEGLPAADPMFTFPYFLYGYLLIKESGIVKPDEKAVIEEMIISSMRLLFHYPEWGAHNRCMLRVAPLCLSIEAMKGHPVTEEWDQMSRFMAEDTFGHWSIEDAELYLALWMKGTMEYAHYTGKADEYYAMPQTRYYFDYITRLLTPYGQIPDFGDSHFNSNWYIWAAILEKGASVYRSGHMKYAANKIVEFGLSVNSDPAPGIASYFALAHDWSDDEIEPVRPDWTSGEVLEDVIGKKIAFRSGWEENDLFLLFNYRDEGNFSRVPREYLRNTISVKAEKMHHGHAEENAVMMLVKGQSILLNEGGYRETLPNGKYRADLYHNRLVFREGPVEDQESVYHALHNKGHYEQVNTEKLHYQSFGPVDYSRTRLVHPKHDLTWDRCMTYIKQDDVFIVVDWVQAGRDIELAVANLWHTGIAQETATHAYATHIPHVYKGIGDQNPYINQTSHGLMVEFVDSSRRVGTEAIRRGYGDSTMVYEYERKKFAAGEMDCFITVLTPYERSGSPDASIGRVQVEKRLPEQQGLALTYNSAGQKLHLVYKLNRELGLLEEDAYPRYTWDDGKQHYGSLVTDADFAYVSAVGDKGQYGFINGSGLEFGTKSLFRTPKFSSYQFEEEAWIFADHKWKAWEGSFNE